MTLTPTDLLAVFAVVLVANAVILLAAGLIVNRRLAGLLGPPAATADGDGELAALIDEAAGDESAEVVVGEGDVADRQWDMGTSTATHGTSPPAGVSYEQSDE